MIADRAQGRARSSQARGAAGRRRPDQLPGGRHGLTAEAVAGSQRERLLAAMAEAVGEHGYRGAFIGDVVERAGVSRKTFYELYEDKEACFAAAYEAAMSRLAARAVGAVGALGAVEAVGTQADWRDGLRAALATLLEALAADPGAARVCFVEVMAAGPKVVERREAALRGLAPLFDAVPGAVRELSIFDALVDGRLADLAERLHREVAAGRAAELPALLPELMYALVLAFMGPEAAAAELDTAEPGIAA